MYLLAMWVLIQFDQPFKGYVFEASPEVPYPPCPNAKMYFIMLEKIGRGR